MRQLAIAVLAAGWTLSAAALAWAGEPDVVWPEQWTVFGPIRSKTYGTSLYGRPRKEDLLPGEQLKTIPRELVIGAQSYQGRPLRLEQGMLNLGQKLACTGDGTGAYLFAQVTATADTRIEIGAGADWWMQWWVDGQPIFDTLGQGHVGNGTTPITGRDHVVGIDLAKGQHVLAVAVFGFRQFLFAVTSPQQLREQPLTFQEALAAGRRKYRPPHWSIPVNYAAARADFQRAAALAARDQEQAEARLALADNLLLDPRTADFAAVRKEYEAAASLPRATPGQKAKAALGIGETWLREDRCERARQEFARAAKMCPDGLVSVSARTQLGIARSYLWERNERMALAELKRLEAVMYDVDRRSGDPLFSFEVRMHLAAAEVAPRVRPDHPRLFFNTQTWPAVRERILADAAGLKRLQREAGGLPAQPEVKDWGRELMKAALVYRVTRDAALLKKICRLLRATVDHYLQRTDFNSHCDSRLGCVAALDWLWNELDPAEREGLARDLIRYLSGFQADLTAMFATWGEVYYYEANVFWYAGLTLIDPGLDNAARMRVLLLLGQGYDNNVNASIANRIDIMKERGGVGNVDYDLVSKPEPSWAFLHCWRSAIGPIPDAWAFGAGFAPSYVLRNALGFRSRSYRHFGFGNTWRPSGGWMPGETLYDNLKQFIYLFGSAQPEEARIAAWLRLRLEKDAGCAGTGSYAIYPYLLEPAAAHAPPTLPENLPLARLYGVNGLMLMSSGFEPGESTYALYSCGCRDGRGLSGHFDAGHFTIFKKGYLALDSGTRALWESPPGIAGRNYDFQTVAHNTVLIHMPGETLVCQDKPIQSNSGGQCKMPSHARVLAFEADRLFAYAATDATATYHQSKCAEAVRQFLFLAPDHFVVFDRIVSKKAEYPKTWLLHTANEPVIVDKEFRADQEEGRIFCRTVYPPDAALEKIGGPGKEFWADGRNWPIPAHSPYLKRVGMATPADVQENMGRWRVEVKPGKARTDDVFLHLIQASDQTVEKMVESRVVEKGQQVELTFTIGERTYTISLNKAGQVGGHMRVEEGAKVLVDKGLTHRIQPHATLSLTK